MPTEDTATSGGELHAAPSQQAAQQPPASSSGHTELAHEIARLNAEIQKREAENFKLREDRRTLREQVKELEERQVSIPDGGQVFTADQVAAFRAYSSLGKPDELQAKLGSLVELQREREITRAAGAAGYNANVLARLLPEGAALTVEENPEGQPVAKIEIDGNSHVLDQFASDHWADFMPALVTKKDTPADSATWIRQPAQARAPQRANPREAALQAKKNNSSYRAM